MLCLDYVAVVDWLAVSVPLLVILKLAVMESLLMPVVVEISRVTCPAKRREVYPPTRRRKKIIMQTVRIFFI